MAGTLYVVATPIGNLEDITLRALRTLKEVDLIAAEDTRVTHKLLARYDIHTRMLSYHSHSRLVRTEEILEMLRDGRNVALVSDAGTPGISDPGHELTKLVIEAGMRVECIPGASAVVTGLVLSGLPTARFSFDGFPPRKESERRRFFEQLSNEPRTVCVYEAPTRLVKTLESIRTVLGERQIAVVREATKKFEEVFRGTAAEAMDHFSAKEVRGEIVIVIERSSEQPAAADDMPLVSVEERLHQMMSLGLSERDAVKACAAEMKLPKRDVYAVALRLKAHPEP